MSRGIVAGVLGYLVWSVLWVGGGAGLQSVMPEAFVEGRVEDSTALLLFLVLSVVCSLAAGVCAQKIAPLSRGRTVFVMALVLLITGIGVQASAWENMPVWYHLTFLALLVPVCVVGGKLARRP